MFSPLEKKPRILEKIGLFIVLFNIIDNSLETEFYYVIDQSNKQRRPILDFLVTRDFAQKLDILKFILGIDLYSKIKRVNQFRNFIVHGLYGMDLSGRISMAKRKIPTGEYRSIDDLEEYTLNQYIQDERNIHALFHNLILKRLKSK